MTAAAPATRTMIVLAVNQASDGTTLVQVEVHDPAAHADRRLAHYHVSRLPAGGYLWQKFACEGGERHEVVIGREQGEPTFCDCLGWRRWRKCRHVSGTRVLLERRKL